MEYVVEQGRFTGAEKAAENSDGNGFHWKNRIDNVIEPGSGMGRVVLLVLANIDEMGNDQAQ